MSSIGSLSDGSGLSAGMVVGRPAVSRRLRTVCWWIGKSFVLVSLLGLSLEVATKVVAEQPADEAQPHATTEAWTDLHRPLALFSLAGTEFAKLPLRYTAFRNAQGGGRRDVLVFGDAGSEEAWLELSFYRLGTEAVADAGYKAVVRDTGSRIASVAAPTALPTRFGSFEVSDLRLTAPRGTRPCLGFHTAVGPTGMLRIAGLACGTAERPMGRDLLNCIIDRIDLLSAGDDETLRDVFVAAERRRGSACLPSPLTSAGSHTTWLDANASAPALRSLSARPQRGW